MEPIELADLLLFIEQAETNWGRRSVVVKIYSDASGFIETRPDTLRFEGIDNLLEILEQKTLLKAISCSVHVER